MNVKSVQEVRDVRNEKNDMSEIARIATSRVAQRGAKNVTAEEIILAMKSSSFAFEIFKLLGTMSEGNIFFSPYSISSAFAMIYAGASGRTEQEIGETLRYKMIQEHLHRTFSELEESLEKRANTGMNELQIANTLWIQKDFKLLATF